MSEETEKKPEETVDVESRLVREGNLTRNSGTNSLKSLKAAIINDNEKFGEVFGAISKSLFDQTRVLTSIDKNLAKTFEFSTETKQKEEQTERLGEAESASNRGGQENIGAPNISMAVARGTFMADLLTQFKENASGFLANSLPRITKGIMGIVKGIPLLILAPVLASAAAGLLAGFTGFDVKGAMDEAMKVPVEEGGVSTKEMINSLAITAGTLIIGGPVRAMKSAMAAMITNMGENILGVDIPDNIQNAIQTVFGFAPLGLTAKAIRGAVAAGNFSKLGLMGTSLLNPVSLAVIGVGAALAGLIYLLKKGGDKRKELDLAMLEAAAETDEMEELLKAKKIAETTMGGVSGYSLDAEQQARRDAAYQVIVGKIETLSGQKIETLTGETPEDMDRGELIRTLSTLLGSQKEHLRDLQHQFEPENFEELADARKEVFAPIIERGYELGLNESEMLDIIMNEIPSTMHLGRVLASGMQETSDYYNKKAEEIKIREDIGALENVGTVTTPPTGEIDTSGIMEFLGEVADVYSLQPEPISMGVIIPVDRDSFLSDTVQPIMPDYMGQRVDNLDHISSDMSVTSIVNSFNTSAPSDNRKSIMTGVGSQQARATGGGTIFTYGSEYKKGNR